MNIFASTNHVAALSCAKHLRLKARIKEVIEDNTPAVAYSADDPNSTMREMMLAQMYADCTKLYTVKVQVKILGIWVTVWAETCDFSDGDTRPYIKNCAEEVHQALTESI